MLIAVVRGLTWSSSVQVRIILPRRDASHFDCQGGSRTMPEPIVISDADAKQKTPADLFAQLASSPQGLSGAEAQARLDQYGPNALEEKKEHPLLKFLSYFWGPIPWMIEVAAVLSALVEHWGDLIIIVFLLVFNAIIGFWEEHEASNALEALKEQLALKARVLRDGSWQEIEARDLVPGDVIRVRLGDIIPADVKLVEGEYLSVDQAALTGESLPVNKGPGDIAYSGSIAKQGEMVALVTSTGGNTFFARTAKLVETAGAVSHFQKAVMRVGDFLIVIAIGLSIILIVVELHRGLPVLDLVEFVLILVVASIPVAMPAVLSVTMALGALALSKMKAIVSRLQAIEEMAGIDVLCSDKTGTLTLNQLTLGEPMTFSQVDAQNVIMVACLASREENRDAIDDAVFQGLEDKSPLEACKITKFIPFDPVHKRTEATVQEGDKVFKVTKGAPQVILELCHPDSEVQAQAQKAVDDLAAKGYRTLGVARADDGDAWRFLGILPLYDPPRKDAAETIGEAQAHGIQVKMITGDNVAIGREIAGQLGLGTNIQPATDLFPLEGECEIGGAVVEKIEKADGFAEVYPEHKYNIVKALQGKGHLVAMTGDGVNDAPALKQAEVGIAVSGATNAAQSAAALVLTEPGLKVITHAVEEARRIFARMMSYTVYRISMTISIMVFVVAAMLCYNVFPLTAMMIIILALLDDIPIMTIAYDNTYLSPTPVRWEMNRVLTVSTVLGFLATIESFMLFFIGRNLLHLPLPQVQTLLFLRLAAGGHLLLFVTRTKNEFWQSPYPSWPLVTAIFSTQIVAVLMCGFGWLVPVLPWKFIAYVWIYIIIWMLIQDICKLGLHAMVENRLRHKRRFLEVVNQPLRQPH
jgi:H+-transporting ATPase